MALKFRRGTTAQQSGSLAFGEPFVNTTLGTLLVGGDNGDIQLATAGESSTFVGASVSASTFISGSSLKITGNAAIDGNLTLGGAITIGDATADTVNIVASLSSSLVPSDDNIFNIGSTSFRYANVYATTISASAYTGIGNLTTYSTSVDSRVNTLETSISTLSSSVFQTDATQSTNIETATAAAAGAFASASAYSASAAVIDNGQDVKIASLESNILSASVFTTFSTSVDSRLDSVELLSASANTAYAKLIGGNIYTGTQTVTGSVYVSGDLIIQGSSSLQNITASAVTLGTNTIILNTDTPAVRFAGISVIDSGSNAGTGSLWWDSLANHWVYEHPADSGAPYNSAILISGPKNSGSLGEEIGLMTGFVPVASGDDHITNSIISASLSKVTIEGDLDVSLGFSASVIVGLGHVSTYSASVANRIDTIETTYATSASIASATATSISTLSGSVKARTDQTITINGTAVGLGGTLTTAQTLAGAISSSEQVQLTSTTGYSTFSSSVASATATSISTLSGSVKAVTDTLAVSSSVKAVTDALSGRVTTLEGKDISVTLTGDVTGTGTITDLGNVSFATTIAANSVALGTDTTGDYVASLVAGTGVTLTNNSGESATPTIAIGQSVATNATPTFGNLTINGTITATGDITAYYTSDKRHKNNIQIIPNALEKVSKLNGVTWEWNEDVNEVTKSTPKTGLIAQEVQEVLPEVVTERQDGFLGLDYSKMMGLMVEAIKEQQTQIHKLTTEIEDLKKQKGL